MTEIEISELREALAELEHARWAGWQNHVHGLSSKYFEDEDSLTIPAALVRRWERQIVTPYADLSEAEKASDREEADRTIELLFKFGVLP